MATRLNKETLESGRKSQYDWDQWLDGSVWEAIEGEDYTCKQQSFVSQLYKAAYDRGKHVHVRPDVGRVEWEAYVAEVDDEESRSGDISNVA